MVPGSAGRAPATRQQEGCPLALSGSSCSCAEEKTNCWSAQECGRPLARSAGCPAWEALPPNEVWLPLEPCTCDNSGPSCDALLTSASLAIELSCGRREFRTLVQFYVGKWIDWGNNVRALSVSDSVLVTPMLLEQPPGNLYPLAGTHAFGHVEAWVPQNNCVVAASAHGSSPHTCFVEPTNPGSINSIVLRLQALSSVDTLTDWVACLPVGCVDTSSGNGAILLSTLPGISARFLRAIDPLLLQLRLVLICKPVPLKKCRLRQLPKLRLVLTPWSLVCRDP